MSISNTQPETSSKNDVYAICRHSTDPEKCAEFVDELESIGVNQEITDDLAARVETDSESRDR